MTAPSPKNSSTPDPASTEVDPPSSQPVSSSSSGDGWKGGVVALAVFVFRLAVLGLGIGAGWAAGVLVAQVFPATASTPPLQEIWLRRTQQFTRKVKTLPAWWSGRQTASLAADERITLPSSLLFAADQVQLTPEGQQLLDTIVGDLSRYPGATLLVGGHGNTADSAVENRELTFQQALAVQQYLAPQLGETYHWGVVGYGQSRPVEPQAAATAATGPDTPPPPSGEPPNQRVEIMIIPRT